jgi:hypothetical protein
MRMRTNPRKESLTRRRKEDELIKPGINVDPDASSSTFLRLKMRQELGASMTRRGKKPLTLEFTRASLSLAATFRSRGQNRARGLALPGTIPGRGVEGDAKGFSHTLLEVSCVWRLRGL